jgi:hypothetical protein
MLQQETVSSFSLSFTYHINNLSNNIHDNPIYTTTTTDKYTDGYNTLYVDRTHVGVAQNEETSWKENHYCTRCKHSFSKSNGYTITEKKS